MLWVFDAVQHDRAAGARGPGSATDRAPLTSGRRRARRRSAGGPTVNGSGDGADGEATLTFGQRRIYNLKAERGRPSLEHAGVCVNPEGRAVHLHRQGRRRSLEMVLAGQRLARARRHSRTVLF